MPVANPTLNSRDAISNSIAGKPHSLGYALGAIAGFLVLLGCVTLAARYLTDLGMQDALYGTPIPRYNVSIAFIASGIGLIGAQRRWTLVTLSAALAVLAIGGVRLADYVSGIDLRNDDLLWLAHRNAGAPYAVRLTAAVALAFPIAGAHLVLSVLRKPRRGRIAAMELLGFLVFAFGVAGMTGQVEGGNFAAGWGSYTRMSLLTAIGLIGLGIGLCALTWDQRDRRVARFPLWIPAAICFLVFLLDLATPRGVAISTAYIPLLFCGLWFKRPRAAFAFATFATIAAIGVIFAKPPGSLDLGRVVTNRAILVTAIWIVAVLADFAWRSAAAAQQSERRFRAAVDNAVDGFIEIDARGIIEAFNPACERIFGYAAAEVIGRSIGTLMPETDRGTPDAYFGYCVATAATEIVTATGREVAAKRKDGSVFPMDIALGEFTLPDGRHFCGVVRDIANRKKGEETVRLLAAIVAASDDAIVSKTTDGIITSWNAAAERLFGYTAATAVGQHIGLIIPPERREEEAHIIAQITAGRSIEHFETERMDRNGERIDISTSISPLRDTAGRVIGAAKVIRDIRARKQHEAELAGHIAALERSNQELDDFAYIASHDLKEPLRGLFNHAKFLREDYADKLDQEGVNRLMRLGYLTQRMEQLVNDLLHVARLGRQELAIQPTDLNTVIRDIEFMSETTLAERNAAIVVPRPLPTIFCDTTRIAEVFRNLITNAVKYNDRDLKRVEIGFIDVPPAARGSQTDIFYVKDNGIGIAEEFHEDIFRIFKRLNAEDDDKKGTGVGLTFVRKIVERHGGRIWLASRLGTGTTFYFTLDQGAAYEAAA